MHCINWVHWTGLMGYLARTISWWKIILYLTIFHVSHNQYWKAHVLLNPLFEHRALPAQRENSQYKDGFSISPWRFSLRNVHVTQKQLHLKQGAGSKIFNRWPPPVFTRQHKLAFNSCTNKYTRKYMHCTKRIGDSCSSILATGNFNVHVLK